MKHHPFSTALLPFFLTLCLILTSCSGTEANVQKKQSGGTASAQTGQQTESSKESSTPYTAKAAGSKTQNQEADSTGASEATAQEAYDFPDYSGNAYAVINDNIPEFREEELTTTSYETYGALDELGRCTTCTALIGTDLMPSGERGSIGMIRPTGWHTVKYDWIDGKYLYNRCHLIGYQLTAENANKNNLITGTRYLNINGMLPFENMTADYIKETGNHVFYRVTPVFDGSNLLASGVHMEAQSIEDQGEGIQFNVYCYNIEPGVNIDYTTGESSASGTISSYEDSGSSDMAEKEPETLSPENSSAEQTGSGSSAAASDTQDSTETGSGESSVEASYIINTNTGKFHYPDCPSVSQMSEKNKQEFTGTRDELLAIGYQPCGNCCP